MNLCRDEGKRGENNNIFLCAKVPSDATCTLYPIRVNDPGSPLKRSVRNKESIRQLKGWCSPGTRPQRNCAAIKTREFQTSLAKKTSIRFKKSIVFDACAAKEYWRNKQKQLTLTPEKYTLECGNMEEERKRKEGAASLLTNPISALGLLEQRSAYCG